MIARPLPAEASSSQDALWEAIARVLREADEAERAARPDLQVVGGAGE